MDWIGRTLGVPPFECCGTPEMLTVIVLSLHLIFASLLVVVVLLQRSEGGGLGMGSSSGGFMTGRGTANALTRATAALAALFFVTSISLTLLARQSAKTLSPLDAPAVTQPVGGAALPKSGDNVKPGDAKPAEPAKSTEGGGLLKKLEETGPTKLPLPKSQ